MAKPKAVVKVGTIQQQIRLIRGEKVIVDPDLAEAYGVPTRRLNEQVKRNQERFPEDFMFQLAADESEDPASRIPSQQRESPHVPGTDTYESR